MPASRVFRAPDMLEDPQYAARGSIVETEHPVFGRIRMQNAFPKLSRTPGKVEKPGPGLGEHTYEVLAALGYGDDEVAALVESGAVAGPAGEAQGSFMS